MLTVTCKTLQIDAPNYSDVEKSSSPWPSPRVSNHPRMHSFSSKKVVILCVCLFVFVLFAIFCAHDVTSRIEIKSTVSRFKRVLRQLKTFRFGYV